LLGIWQLIYTVQDAVTTFTIVQGFYRPATGGAGWYMSFTFMHFFLAVWLLKFAPQTAGFFYPNEKPGDSASDEKPSDSSTPPI